MGRTSRLGVAGVAVAVLAVAIHSDSVTGASGSRQQVAHQSPSQYAAAPASLAPLVTPIPEPSKGDTSSSKKTVRSAPKVETVPVPTDTSLLTISIRTKRVGTIPAQPANAPEVVHAAAATQGRLFTPPEPKGCPWVSPHQVRDGEVPDGCDWSGTSLWLTQMSTQDGKLLGTWPYPTSPSTGTSYVYGHSCNRRICPFSAIKWNLDGSYTVTGGDQVVVGTPTGTLTYTVCAVGLSIKASGSIRLPSGCGARHIDLVVITCDEVVLGRNIVVATTLTAARRK
jgi:hypothetical protein